ncbi:A/G-specific adenine glycosylase [Ignatzschineria rhizosphaerae]|uniref:Adenine DNA glycosylase n=1 Tax=Ignatzschineria rhizosphaerae TaxID=2923279 RepID=A0ABY3X151_9GAMM|nr:A/G-specific adenine glycosylase [Ignatzschineria rhizosphaerae]UNM95192.1 A/G-specific adenine glycosylase [Ignatzschineria rhizosphaerae]
MNNLNTLHLEDLPQDETLLQQITQKQVLYFQEHLLEWFEREGRHDLPWKPQAQFSEKINLYRIWISEIMLQQTQVVTVLPYFERFMAAFPTPEDLAKASEEEVLKLWQGLGYYSRARNLHAASKQLVLEFNGIIPPDFEAIRRLKGIGDTTANAILAQGFNLPFAILDGNVRRVLTRITGMMAPRKELDKRLKPFSETFLCRQNPADYTQAIMDFGATLCKLKPLCERCFLQQYCSAFIHEKVAEIPAKPIKKKNPTESVALILYWTETNQILLEKRPTKGIWGNLYSLPELLLQGKDQKSTSSAIIHEKTLNDFPHKKQLANIRHQFTHYTLEASLFKIPVSDEYLKALISSQNLKNYRMVTVNDALLLPKPQPIAELLNQIATNSLAQTLW